MQFGSCLLLLISPLWVSGAPDAPMLRAHRRHLDDCEDSLTTTFLDTSNTTRDCIWLSGRNSDIEALCSEGSDAYAACPDTCGACVDPCEDADDTVKLPMYTADPSQQIYVYNSTCSRLADRPRDWDNACAVAEISALCQDVCNSCGPVAPTTSPPTPAPVAAAVATPAPVTAAPVAPTPAPTPRPTGACDDQHFTLFTVLGQKEKNCAWLAPRIDTRIVDVAEFTNTSSYGETTFGELLCVAGEDAYDICEETCGQCSDTCTDTDGIDLDEDTEGLQDCAWLRTNPRNHDRYCRNKRNFAYNTLASTYCQETCETCT